MKTLNQPIKILLAAILFVSLSSAQETNSTNNPSSGRSISPTSSPVKGTISLDEIVPLEQRKKQLEKHLSTLPPASDEYHLVADWIQELNEKIRELRPEAPSPIIGISPSSPPQSQLTCISSKDEPAFCLSVPGDKKTAEATETTLTWTKDSNTARNYTIAKFIVEVAAAPEKFLNGRFRKPVFQKEVIGDGSQTLSLKIPEDTLTSGKQYYWQVFAVYKANGGPELLKAGRNKPIQPGSATADTIRTFKTAQQNFGGLEDVGLTLQRTVAGDNATEAAEFGFLKTFNKKTVYTANFALIYNSPEKLTQTSASRFQASIQGSLSSEESESEDALQFRAGAVITKAFQKNDLNGFTLQLGAKYEADQKFKVGKFMSENMITPTVKQLAIGFPVGKSSVARFSWRPFFYFDVGRTLKRGGSNEIENTVLRFSPRIRGLLTLHFLRRALNLSNTYLYFDNQFYYLPLEDKKRHNFFSSGFQLQVTNNFGFGFTYKNGETAPKFKRVNTFGGVLTVRFGKNED